MARIWNKLGLPHKGWEHQSVVDLKELTESCAMCNLAIRFKHLLRHQKVAQEIGVGCVCAAKLGIDPILAQMREHGVKAKENARTRWLGRMGSWHRGKYGDEYRRLNRILVRVSPQHAGLWIWCVQGKASPEASASLEEAKAASFDGYWKLRCGGHTNE